MYLSRHIVCISLYSSDYSRSSVYLNSNSARRANIEFIKIRSSFLHIIGDLISLAKNSLEKNTVVVVLSPSHVLVIVLRVIWRGSIILDAGWPLVDAAKTRERGVFRILKAIIIDFLSFHMASKVILESVTQMNRIRKLMVLKKDKLSVIFTGVNESAFGRVSIKMPELSLLDEKKPTVLFRGSFNPESGLDTILRMSRLPGAERFNLLILTNNPQASTSESPNLVIVTRRLKVEEISHAYKVATLCLGQLSENSRLEFTIPHKAFEAGFFGKPYLTGDYSAVRELYNSHNQVVYIRAFDENSLLLGITQVLSNPQLLMRLGTEINKRYKSVANQDKLGSQFLSEVLIKPAYTIS